MFRSRKFFAGITLAVLLIVSSLLYFGILGEDPGKSRTYGFVEMQKIFRTHSFFKEARAEWESSKERLEEEYRSRLLDLQREVLASGISPAKFLRANPAAEKLRSRNTDQVRSPHHSSEKEAGDEGLTKRMRTRIKVLTARRNRSEHVIENKREELLQIGQRRIRKAIESVVEQQGLTTIYKKPQVVYRRGGTGTGGFARQLEARNITDDVIEYMSNNPEEFEYQKLLNSGTD